MNIEIILFYFLAATAIVASLLMITRANPISSALWLVLCFLSTAGIFGLLGSAFLAVLQILLYAGAIMVLFIFVVMLINLESKEIKRRVITIGKVFAVLISGYLAIILAIAVLRPTLTQAPDMGASFLEPKRLGTLLLSEYMIPFELLSVLLLIAIIGSVVLAKNKL